MSTLETIALGTLASDGTGDKFRSGGQKINNNFVKLSLWAGGDSAILTPFIHFDSDKIVFEGSSFLDTFQTFLSAANPTADNTVIIPDASGTIVLDTETQTLSGKTLTDPYLVDPIIKNSGDTYHYIIAINGSPAANKLINFPLITADSDFVVFEGTTQTLVDKTLNSAILNSPKIVTAVLDTNGADLFRFTATGSAVNEFTVANSAAGSGPNFSATGSDSDITLNILGKNGGPVRMTKGAYNMATMTASGAISRTRTYINFNSGIALAATLANGVVSGEFKKLTNAGAGTVTVTPANFAQGTSFALAQNEACEVIWNGTNWFVISNYSTLTIA